MFDLDELPNKFFHKDEVLSEGKYIDDNSLYLYQLLAKGMFSNGSPSSNFFYFKPFEWETMDFVAFLMSASKQYGLEIKNIETNMSPITEEYEVEYYDENKIPNPALFKVATEAIKNYKGTEKTITLPKTYDGAYEWFLDKSEQNDQPEPVKLFATFEEQKATVADIERALIYADRILPMYEKHDTERFMTKELFKHIINWTTFLIILEPQQKKKLDADLDKYMNEFMNNGLTRDTKFPKKVRNVSISQSKNVFTYKKHDKMFREYLQKMYDDFGNTFTLENIFEDRFSNDDFLPPEYIRKRFSERNFLFLHTLFSYEKRDLIKIISVGCNWDLHEENFLTYQVKIEILPAFINEDKLKKLHFDPNKSRFYVRGNEIKILKFKDEYHTLRIMFEDPSELSQEWFFSEIRERVDKATTDDKKYYNAIYQLKLKLSKLGINDFFITTKQSVKINSKYLS
jgi:hypothetical protein